MEPICEPPVRDGEVYTQIAQFKLGVPFSALADIMTSFNCQHFPLCDQSIINMKFYVFLL